MEKKTVIILAVIIALILCSLITYYVITYDDTPTISNQNITYNIVNIKLLSNEQPVEGEYLILEQNKQGFVKKDFISQVEVINNSNYTFYVTAKGYYSKKVTYYPSYYNLLEVQLDKVGTLSIDNQVGNLNNPKIDLTLKTDSIINNLGYCFSLTQNLINLHDLSKIDYCSYNWVNFKLNNSYNFTIAYYPKGVYRCPNSYESINQEDFRDKIQTCESTIFNQCYIGTSEIPQKYRNKAIQCFDLNKNLKSGETFTINFELKKEDTINENDAILLYFYDKDLRFIDNSFKYGIGSLEQELIIK